MSADIINLHVAAMNWPIKREIWGFIHFYSGSYQGDVKLMAASAVGYRF